jgi:peptide/nickel transport system ATP-binding protein
MLVEIANLWVRFPTPHGMSDAVRGVTLTLGQEKFGVVGESGSGKSPTARAILRLLPDSAVITADKLSFDDIDVMIANEAALRPIRGKRAGLILQDPKFSLNPVMTAGAQIAEAWHAHRAGTPPLPACTESEADPFERRIVSVPISSAVWNETFGPRYSQVCGRKREYRAHSSA